MNFTIHTCGGTSCELLLFHRAQEEPFAVLPFPEAYKIGDVYSMIVYGLNIDEFEYAYRVDGPYCPEKGLLFNKNNVLLDLTPKLLPVRGPGGSAGTIPTMHEWSRTPSTGAMFRSPRRSSATLSFTNCM